MIKEQNINNWLKYNEGNYIVLIDIQKYFLLKIGIIVYETIKTILLIFWYEK